MRIRSLLFSALAALLAGCIPTGACTLIGCFDGLSVEFSRPPAGPFRIEATVANGTAVQPIECTDASSCDLTFRDLIAEQVTLRLTTAEGTLTQSFQPRYEDLYPNGRRCGPSCRQATVTFQLPG
ncbi:hypothetical protein [Longimicrobium sp.]|uniref:hypothetical protein n=1 Tax=Longimicrobium sp. TaxID=2029185 RepID=UPI003B3AFF91